MEQLYFETDIWELLVESPSLWAAPACCSAYGSAPPSGRDSVWSKLLERFILIFILAAQTQATQVVQAQAAPQVVQAQAAPQVVQAQAAPQVVQGGQIVGQAVPVSQPYQSGACPATCSFDCNPASCPLSCCSSLVKKHNIARVKASKGKLSSKKAKGHKRHHKS